MTVDAPLFEIADKYLKRAAILGEQCAIYGLMQYNDFITICPYKNKQLSDTFYLAYNSISTLIKEGKVKQKSFDDLPFMTSKNRYKTGYFRNKQVKFPPINFFILNK